MIQVNWNKAMVFTTIALKAAYLLAAETAYRTGRRVFRGFSAISGR